MRGSVVGETHMTQRWAETMICTCIDGRVRSDMPVHEGKNRCVLTRQEMHGTRRRSVWKDASLKVEDAKYSINEIMKEIDKHTRTERTRALGCTIWNDGSHVGLGQAYDGQCRQEHANECTRAG